MERLTIPDVRVDEHTTRKTIIDARAVREHAMDFYWRLKAYEDTGLEPEKVLPKDKADEIALKLMRLADLESLCSYTRLRELAETDKDGRVVALPCKGLSTKLEDGRQMILEQAIAHIESLLKDHDFECEACKQDHRDLLELLVELKERRDDNGNKESV